MNVKFIFIKFFIELYVKFTLVFKREVQFQEFFLTVKSRLREKREDVIVDYQPFTLEDKTLMATFRRKKEAVHTALCGKNFLFQQPGK